MEKYLKPTIVLLIICSIAGSLLGYAYEITKEPIRIQAEKKEQNALKKVLPTAEKVGVLDTDLSAYDNILLTYNGTLNEEKNGYIIKVAQNGYSGVIEFLVGFDLEGTITGLNILKHTETPGLGANVTSTDFTNQYIGKSGNLSVTKSPSPADNEIAAMTSATITTTAVTNGVNSAIEVYENIK